VKCYCLEGDFFLFSVSWHHSILLQTHWACLSKKLSSVCFCLRFKTFLKWHMALSVQMFGPMVSYLNRRHSEFGCTEATQQLTLSPIGVADSGFFQLDHSSANTADADTPSLSLQDFDGLSARNSRHSTSSETLCVWKMCS